MDSRQCSSDFLESDVIVCGFRSLLGRNQLRVIRLLLPFSKRKRLKAISTELLDAWGEVAKARQIEPSAQGHPAVPSQQDWHRLIGT
jgi:hypothetical protein